MPKITIHHIPIEGARKDRDWETGESYKADNQDHVSEWAVAIAVQSFQDGQTVEEEILIEAIELAKVQQTIDLLVERGMMRMLWDPEQGTVVYNVTEKGRKAVENSN